jgi:hypothetical protein
MQQCGIQPPTRPVSAHAHDGFARKTHFLFGFYVHPLLKQRHGAGTWAFCARCSPTSAQIHLPSTPRNAGLLRGRCCIPRLSGGGVGRGYGPPQVPPEKRAAEMWTPQGGRSEAAAHRELHPMASAADAAAPSRAAWDAVVRALLADGLSDTAGMNVHEEIVYALLSDRELYYASGPCMDVASALLAVAAGRGRTAAVASLLALPRVDASWNGSHALREAARNGRDAVVHALLADGRADPAADDSVAVRHAASCGHANVVAALLADGRANPAAVCSVALRDAALEGHVAIVHALLADGRADPGAKCSQALRLAADMNHVDVVQALLADGRANPAAMNSEALCHAAEKGHDVVLGALLLDGRADPAAESSMALRVACSTYDCEVAIVSALLADGRADPSAESNFALRAAAFNAAQTGDGAVFAALLADGRADLAAILPAIDKIRGAAEHPDGPVVIERCLATWTAWKRRRAWVRACACVPA